MATRKVQLPAHLDRLLNNTAEVQRLAEIHEELTGATPGRKHGVEVLNKSAIVLLVACWEDFIEELAKNSFQAIFQRARSPDVFPTKVLALAGKALREDSDESKIWGLAGRGWKDRLNEHKDQVLKRYIGRLNTPKPEQIDQLFESLVGMRSMSAGWGYPGMSSERAANKVTRLVELRGQIAHKVAAESSVTKAQVLDYSHFIHRLAGMSSNRAGEFVERRVGRRPWSVSIRYTGQRGARAS